MYLGCHDGMTACTAGDVLVEGNLVDGVTSPAVGYALEIKLEERRAAREKSGVASVAHGTMAGRFDSARGEESPSAKARREAMERQQNAWKN